MSGVKTRARKCPFEFALGVQTRHEVVGLRAAPCALPLRHLESAGDGPVANASDGIERITPGHIPPLAARQIQEIVGNQTTTAP